METYQKTSQDIGRKNGLTEKQKRYFPLKRIIDVILSGAAILILSPILAGISIAIKLDSPGPIIFKQKRVGKNKVFFEILKFRTMRVDTPKDKPTHMLSAPDQYITKIGKFLRKTSLDELPQIFNIFTGEMTICGPRPALWNQDDLIDERDKYGANDVTPGLTGWAQINGRDELEIPLKAKFDGEYVKNFGFLIDAKCFFGTIGSVLDHSGVVEGGTGELHKTGEFTVDIANEAKIKKEIYTGMAIAGGAAVIGIGCLGLLVKYFKGKTNTHTYRKSKSFKGFVIGLACIQGVATAYINLKRRVRFSDDFVNDRSVDKNKNISIADSSNTAQKKILITGAGSFIGESVENWLEKQPDRYKVTTIDMLTDTWKETDFSVYDVIYHVADIAHADLGDVTDEQKQLYYKVNTDIAVGVAERAKKAGVKQFIFMSSMIVYSGCRENVVTENTIPKPLNFYGDSKWQADQKIRELQDKTFKVVVLRPPMIYGKGSKGNYPELAKLAEKLPVFPIVKNKRSMLHIENLCEFVRLIIDNEESGVFFSQNVEYTNTSDMVQMIATVKGHSIIMVPFTNLPVKLMGKIPGKIGGLATKAFGDSIYDMSMSEYKENYRVNSLRRSIELTEDIAKGENNG